MEWQHIFGPLAFHEKNQVVLIEYHYTLFTNGYLSHIVSYISSQTLIFEYLIKCSNLYVPQIWTPPYVDHNNEKYEITLAIVMQKTCFSILYLIGIKNVLRKQSRYSN